MSMAAIDINSLPTRWRQFDPDAANEAEARTAEQERYVDDWCAGELVDTGETFSGPQQALIDNEGELLAELLADYKHGDAAELEASAGRLARALERYVREQV